MFYALTYVEHIGAGESPLEHFLLRGRAHGLEPLGGSKYEVWLDLFDRIDPDDRELMRRRAAQSDFPALKIVHIFDSEACRDVDLILGALREQVLDRWTAMIVFAEDVPEAERVAVAACTGADPRIGVESGPVPDLGEEYVLLVHGGVRLMEHATYLFMERALSARADFVYSDHDYRTIEGKRRDPRFKPAFSPEFLRHRFYVGSCVLMEATTEHRGLLGRVIEDLRGHGCGELSDALLAASRGSVAHVPFALYSISSGSKELTPRQQLPARSIAGHGQPTVSVVIATRDRIDLLRDCIDSIERMTRYPRDRLQVVVVDNGSVTGEAKQYFTELRRRAGYKVVADPGDFNFSRLNNLGVGESNGDVLVLLNNDMVVIEPRWIELIVAQCLQPDVGAVGAKLLYPDGTIQHGGCNIGVSGLVAHRLVGRPAESVSEADVTRELAAVTGACMGLRREVFELIGGLDETLQVTFNDIKLCMLCLARGLRNIYISEPLLYHYESKSRGSDNTRAKMELEHREAVYTRQQFAALFQNDPYYSPNLSIDRIDELAFPPRRVKPWQRPGKDRPVRVMFLSRTYVIGNGVPLVIQMQARRLVREGFEVLVAGPRGENEFDFEGCRRMHVSTAGLAASVAARENVDCIIAHTPPFFSITRYLGNWPMVYFFDHGEPNPEFFPDRVECEVVNWEKRFCTPLATRVFAISRAIREQSLHEDVVVLRNGNSHMAKWSSKYDRPRRATRAELGWQDKFVVLSVCRFGQAERTYKGVDRLIELKQELWFSHPDTRGKIVFALAGKAEPEDVSEMERQGLAVFPNVSDRFMIELYAASDFYMSFSKWEGYNLGIGQALAMGLPVIASDIEAHREFPIVTTNSVRVANEKLHEHFVAATRSETRRAAVTFDGDEPVGKLVEMIRADLNDHPAWSGRAKIRGVG